MSRERLTWTGKNAGGPRLPVEEAAKRKASAHPATPDEGITHPAGYDDPKQPASYENGNTSSWAEDPHKGPVRTSPAPAVPVDDGGYKHPATQPGAPAKNAADKAAADKEAAEKQASIKLAAEKKAKKCLRLAAALLGTNVVKAAEANDKVAQDMIEDQAFDFMDLGDARLASTLRRLEAATADPEKLLRKMLAGEDAEDVEDEDSEEEEVEEPNKEAATNHTAMEQKLAEIMSALSNIESEMEGMKSGCGAPAMAAAPTEEADAEAMLASMLAEEAAPVANGNGEEAEAEAMLKAMMDEEAAKANAAPAAPEAPSLAHYMEDPMMVDDVVMDIPDDPMGMGDMGMTPEEDALLANLFASDKVGGEAEEEEVEEETETDEEAAKKQAAQAKTVSKVASTKPQPKKPSNGAQTIGNQTRVASTAQGDMSELSRLWNTAPDVSSVFNG